ncbi:hypothetical protein KY290_001123 [Solanum tuberosum]|uniref:Integrase core domain containing protein n=1 Tax=Solanum tuberosum TaxID=4113 RepID=A0ABQ7WLC2_SOLTU|nr:hypothetical protein KY290_001123 [Solanum tuberosum]
MDKTPLPQDRPNRAAQAASDKVADSQTEEVVATIVEVQHQDQPQAGGPAQEVVVAPVETGAKPKGEPRNLDCGAATCDPFI